MKTLEDTERMPANERSAESESSAGGQDKLKSAIRYGALCGLILALLAAAVAVGFDSALIYFRYAIHWAVGFSVVGAWAGAMFFAGEQGAVGHPR